LTRVDLLMLMAVSLQEVEMTPYRYGGASNSTAVASYVFLECVLSRRTSLMICFRYAWTVALTDDRLAN
jgi:hypothetical protein